jgi:hypothetical protein
MVAINLIILNAIMFSVNMLSVVAPFIINTLVKNCKYLIIKVRERQRERG